MITYTPSPEAVEAAASALWSHDASDATPPWATVVEHWPDTASIYRRSATAALTAAGPIIAAEVRESVAREIEASYLGPDSGRSPDGRDAPDADLRHAFDEGLEHAARLARGEGS